MHGPLTALGIKVSPDLPDRSGISELSETERADLLLQILEQSGEGDIPTAFPSTGNPTEDFIAARFAEGLLIRTFMAAIRSPEALQRMIAGDAVLCPPFRQGIEWCTPPVQRFLNACSDRRVPFDLWWHSDSAGKVDIGYHQNQVAITLAWAKDASQTSFFVLCRDDNVRIPRSIVKSLIGVKDLKAGSEQAEANLAGVMRRGTIGPFLSDGEAHAADQIFIDSGSLQKYGDQAVNFSAGADNLSVNVRLRSAVDVLRELYPDRVHEVSLIPEEAS